MAKLALYVPLEAKAGREEEAAEFLRSALPLVEDEPGTTTWYAVRFDHNTFAIFDAFPDEAARGWRSSPTNPTEQLRPPAVARAP
jgi:quinol monooxygenase YgiN